MNTTYRSIFSGPEIDEAIAAMKNSVNELSVANDFEGGVSRVASAELAKTLKEGLDDLNDPSNLQSIIAQAPGVSTFTTTDRLKLDRLKGDFRGVYLNAADRDTRLGLDITGYDGHEISILLDNGFGVGEFSKWNATLQVWEVSHLFGEFAPFAVVAAASIDVFRFDATKYSTLKCIIAAKNATQAQSQEISLVTINGDVYVSVIGDVGNAQMFTIAATVTAGVCHLYATTLLPNLTVSGKTIALI